MLWVAIAVGAALVGAMLFWFPRRAIRPGTEVVVEFDLALPSKWAAELTGRVLEVEGIQSQLARRGRRGLEWVCQVSRRMRFDPAQIDRLCARFDQIAAGRGGGCAAHTVKAGRRVRPFVHRA